MRRVDSFRDEDGKDGGREEYRGYPEEDGGQRLEGMARRTGATDIHK